MQQPSTPVELGRCQAVVLDDLLRLRIRSAQERATDFLEPPAGNVEDRWAIYSSGFLARLPRSYDLGCAGDRLASFLLTDPLSERLPFLPDLAKLEWAVANAFVAADAHPLQRSDLAGLDPKEVASLPLRTVPGTAVVRSEWPLLDIWGLRDVPDGDVNLDVTGRPSTVLIYRRGREVRWRVIDEAEEQLLRAACRGTSLDQLDIRAAGAVAAMVAAFGRLLAAGVFAADGEPG